MRSTKRGRLILLLSGIQTGSDPRPRKPGFLPYSFAGRRHFSWLTPESPLEMTGSHMSDIIRFPDLSKGVNDNQEIISYNTKILMQEAHPLSIQGADGRRTRYGPRIGEKGRTDQGTGVMGLMKKISREQKKAEYQKHSYGISGMVSCHGS